MQIRLVALLQSRPKAFPGPISASLRETRDREYLLTALSPTLERVALFVAVLRVDDAFNSIDLSSDFIVRAYFRSAVTCRQPLSSSYHARVVELRVLKTLLPQDPLFPVSTPKKGVWPTLFGAYIGSSRNHRLHDAYICWCVLKSLF